MLSIGCGGRYLQTFTNVTS